MAIVDNTYEPVTIEVEVNGEHYTLIIPPYLTLLDLLREELGLLGTKMGCEDGNCGVCTVIKDGVAVKSCSTLAVQANGSKIETIEGLERDNCLHPLQQSFIDNFALQCGYCTPGMIMVAKATLDENPNATEDEIRDAIQGNICRCTGYRAIVKAVEDVRDGVYVDYCGEV